MEQKPSQKIQLEIDSDQAFDYINGKSTIYFLKDYLNMIHHEVEMSQLYTYNQLTNKEIQTTKASTVLATNQSMPYFKKESEK